VISKARQQFQRTYVDHGIYSNNAKLLSSRLAQLKTGRTSFFSPWLIIFQSSGTGKTRSVFELAQRTNTVMFYVCGRKPGDTGYPHGTPEVYNLLHSEPERVAAGVAVDADLYLYCRYIAFLWQAWRYAQAGDVHQAKSGAWISEHAIGSVQICDAVRSDAQLLYRAMRRAAGDGAIEISQEDIEGIASNWLRTQLAAAPRALPRRDIMIVVDESRHFQRFPDHSRLRTNPLLQLARAARLLWELGGVLISIDTLPVAVPEGSDFALPNGSPSARTVSLFGTKIMVHTDLQTRDIGYTIAPTVGQALSHRHILTTGRPLWSSQLITETDPTMIYHFIRSKLLCAAHVNAEKLTPEQAAAIVCSRVGLAPHPYSKLSRDLVGSHLAHLEYFDHTKGLAVTSYPADAAVAHASRLIWKDERLLAAALEHVSTLLRAKEMHHDERDLLVTQILMLIAADKVQFPQCACSALCMHSNCNLLGIAADGPEGHLHGARFPGGAVVWRRWGGDWRVAGGLR
jgi:hypothetical protein